MPIDLYPRGFLYTKEHVNVPSDLERFTAHHTSQGRFLIAPETEAEILDDSELVVALIGHAQYVSPTGSENSGDIRVICGALRQRWIDSGAPGVEKYLYDLGGRYVLFILDGEHQYVYHDAHGMRSVYYAIDRTMVSSHDRMLADLMHASFEKASLAALPVSLRWRFSRYQGIKALIPNHRLSLRDSSEERYFPKQQNPYRAVNETERLDLAQDLWRELVRLLSADREVALSLTGGLDSRTSLAMTREIWDRVKTFTYTAVPRSDSPWSRSIYKDEVIVKQILDAVNVEHTLLRRDKAPALSEEEQRVLAKNTAGQHGPWLLKLYQQAFPGNRTMHLRANLHETGRNYFHRYRSVRDPLGGLRKLLREQTLVKSPALAARLEVIMAEHEEQIEMGGYGNLPRDYEVLDMYYWEIRQGRWFSEVFNETDCAFETGIPFNHRRLIDLALSFPANQRRDGYFFRELINRNVPILNFFGVNSTQNLYELGKKATASTQQAKDKVAANRTASRGVVLDGTFRISNGDGSLLSEKPFNGMLYLPESQVLQGYSASVSAKIAAQPTWQAADVHVMVDNSYENPGAANHLELLLAVDGVEVLRHDLSTWAIPYGVTLRGLPLHASITARVTSNRNTPRSSWEKASQTRLQFIARAANAAGQKILTDNPHAHVYELETAN
ncbi:asparagine synthetase B family protein [Glutamicibacter protophormiae]|uniref:hypothetical protein n=1 Tax=Glutamicibacter protophormiae TaxID=37930 RepID=UPI001956DC60|nr:hypothetical protein [Glutamicibacter protophormiae]QRQ79972.1 hypothetical protein JQN66_07135 [Glutamicibacter protophormiae]